MNILLQFKQKFRYNFLSYPRFFILLYRLLAPRKNQPLLVSKDTEIVIEGFPRSGNTFAVVAFKLAQRREVKIAHHLHVESQVLQGIHLGIPVLVLIRNPIDAIRSLITRNSNLIIETEIKRYISFYSTILKVTDRVIVAEFNDVTSDFGKVIARINRKFQTNFALFQHTPDNEKKVFEEIEKINQCHYQGNEMFIGRPSSVRQKIYERMKLDLSPILKEQSLQIYQELVQEKNFY